jgi:uncharacterized protein (TIRG00374 family)
MAKPTLRTIAPWLVLASILGFIAWKLRTSHFDWAGFVQSCRTADLRLLLLAVLLIQANYVTRAMRWAVFLKPILLASGRKPISWRALVGPQFVGFTGLAIFGRIGELIRPLLVSRRTGLTFSSQIAVVAVERVFDLGAFGLIFSLNLLLAPGLQTLPFIHKAGYTIAGLTVAIGLFVLVVRFAGEHVAQLTEQLFSKLSKPFAATVAEKIRSFQQGLDVVTGFSEFLQLAFLSIATWAIIVVTYILVLHAFPSPVRELSAGAVIVLMGFSIAGSALPIPGGGGAWAGNVFALTQLFHVPAEIAAGAGLMVWLIASMSVIPFGLIYAKIEGISLRQVAKKSEQAEASTP